MTRAVAVFLALLALALPIASAQAFFPPGATVMSASPERQELADDSSQVAAISGDGRYVAFQTRATNLFAEDDPDPEGTDRLGGVFRRDVTTGALEIVAAGDSVAEADGALLRTGARNPSISANGRFVSFSTAYALVPTDFNGAVDVYVRDMTLAPDALGAYELISVTAYRDLGGPDGQRLGAEVWPVTSMSADGNLVAWRTNVASDVAGSNTPAGQLLVRDRAARTTRLVTRATSDGAPAGGAAGPVALSADGSTVVWTGANADAQTPILAGEPYFDIENYYLHKRIADGVGAPARRITGIVDLDDPGCAAGSSVNTDPNATGPCYGPLTTTDSGGSAISGRQIAISGDGSQVWYLTPGFRRPSTFSSSTLDLFSADMRTGISRKAGALELTREGAAGDALAGGSIDGLAVTPDGKWLALSTTRVRFGGAALTFGGGGRAIADVREVYLANLQTRGLERVIRNFGGGDASGDAGPQVSIAADGTRVAFTSNASNLFFGDANNRADAFIATSGAPEAVQTPEPEPTPDPAGIIGEPPEDPPALTLRVSRGPGRVLVAAVRVPAAGKLAVRVRGRLPSAGGEESPLRVFAAASAKAKRAQTLRLTLPVNKSFRPALVRFGSLTGSVRATFDPSGEGPELAAARSVRLLAPKGAKRKKQRPRDRVVKDL